MENPGRTMEERLLWDRGVMAERGRILKVIQGFADLRPKSDEAVIALPVINEFLEELILRVKDES